ncbi:hypothetical protein E2P81_ATG07751 [Venturia nashicola]|nr:hypothetical protein E2P81_ATG07751 [Venturia nashicola]
MLTHNALSLLLTLVSLSTSVNASLKSFNSAVGVNVCGKIRNRGIGAQRTEFITVSAMCTTTEHMRLRCRYVSPFYGPEVNVDFYCYGQTRCIATNNSGKDLAQNPDAGCNKIRKPSGVKGEGDSDNYACSSGLNVGDQDIYLLSSISADNSLNQANALLSCALQRSGDGNYKLFVHKPCEKASSVIKLLAKKTYQACISTTEAFRGQKVGFHWNVDSAGSLPYTLHMRDVVDKRPLSEMFTIDDSIGDDFPIVVRERE